jgi:putative spermidine/putrescine transport system substrate-binding protein
MKVMRCAKGSRLGVTMAALFVVGGGAVVVPAAFAQVPATTGLDVIQDVTGSGRGARSEAGAGDRGQGATESPPEATSPALNAVTPETDAGDVPSETSASPAGERLERPTQEAPSSETEAQPASDTASGRTAEPEAPRDGVSAEGEEPKDWDSADRKADGGVGDEAPAKSAEVVEQRPLMVGSWAGAYGQAQQKAIIDPVSRDLEVAIERRAPEEGSASFDGLDVVELSQARLLAACRAGQILNLSNWPKGDDTRGIGGDDDGMGDLLVAAGPDGCGVASFAWSSILVANPGAMKVLAKRRYREPGAIGSLIDVRRYPGKRALIRDPRRLMEMLLLADGVARDEVYRVLATRAGEDRAFELLDDLKADIEWVSGPRAAFAALDNGRATIAMTYSGRAFRRLIASDLRPIWDGHVIDFASWAVPKGTARAGEAVKFIRAALQPERMAAQARIWPYGPMRRSAVRLARRHALLGTQLDVFLPTSELRFAQGIVFNASYWVENGERLQRRFDDWMNGVPLGIRVPPPAKAPPAPLPPPPRLRSAG